MKPKHIVIPAYIRRFKLSNTTTLKYIGIDNGGEFTTKYLSRRLFDPGHQKTVAALKDDYNIGFFNRHDELITCLTPINFLSWLKEPAQWADFNKEIMPHGPLDYYVVDSKSKKVPFNAKYANKENQYTINGQDFYSGTVPENIRAQVIDQIKRSFVPFMQNLSPFEADSYPLRVRMYIFDTVKSMYDRSKSEDGTPWDVGNRAYPYGKAFLDMLVTGYKVSHIDIPPIIIDDNRLYVTEDPQGGIFCPIENSNHRKLIFIIAKDDEHFNDAIKDVETQRLQLLKNSKFYE